MSWQEHVKKTRMAHPSMSFKDALKEASKTYKRQTGGCKSEIGPRPSRRTDSANRGRAAGTGRREKGMKGKGPEHARFSSEIYKKPKERQSVQIYKYKGGDAEQGYWESPSKIVIAYRGTVNKADIKTDAVLAVGLLKKSKRYKKSLAFAKKIMKKATVPVEIVGHSLGGSIATEVARELNLKSFVYNPGMSLKENVRSKIDKAACAIKPRGKRCKVAKLTNVERTRLDPISHLGRKGVNVKHVRQKKADPHTIANWSDKMLKD